MAICCKRNHQRVVSALPDFKNRPDSICERSCVVGLAKRRGISAHRQAEGGVIANKPSVARAEHHLLPLKLKARLPPRIVHCTFSNQQQQQVWQISSSCRITCEPFQNDDVLKKCPSLEKPSSTRFSSRCITLESAHCARGNLHARSPRTAFPSVSRRASAAHTLPVSERADRWADRGLPVACPSGAVVVAAAAGITRLATRSSVPSRFVASSILKRVPSARNQKATFLYKSN